MYEHVDMYVLVRYIIISYRAFSPLGTVYLQIIAVVRKEPSFKKVDKKILSIHFDRRIDLNQHFISSSLLFPRMSREHTLFLL